jgi:mRNA interferase YafQ
MRLPSYTGQSKRDVKLAQKRGKDMGKLRGIISLLLTGELLPRQLNDQPLKGEWKPSRDLYI